MAITDSKSSGWNVSLPQILGVAGVLAVVVAAVWTDSLVLGYTAMTLALCAFFMIVAFDIGVRKPGAEPAAAAAPEGRAEGRAPRARTSREV
jgi:hypothetical protein